MYDVIELIGTSATNHGKRPPPMRSSRPPNLSAIFASQKSSSSICNWTRRERWKPTARRSSYRSNTRSALALSAGPPEPKSQRCPGARVRDSALLACFTPRECANYFANAGHAPRARKLVAQAALPVGVAPTDR